MIMLFIYIVMALSWNLISGYCGQIALSHAAFFGIGAYTFALTLVADTHPLIGLILGGITASFFALIISPSLRLGKAYFAAITLLLAEVMRTVMINWRASGGASGLVLEPFPGHTLTNSYLGALLLMTSTLVATYIIVNSRIGLGFICIRENEYAAAAIGIPVLLYKVIAFCVSGFIAGVAGSYYASYILYIEPYSAFSFSWLGSAAFSCLIGGVGSLIGSIIGASIYLLVSEMFLGFGAFSTLIIGILIIVVVLFFPRGVVGALEKLVKRTFLSSQTK
jgi:branched-chain amino acid transport system permease protein